MNKMTQHKLLLRNLTDAGCDAATIEKYISLNGNGKQQERLSVLCKHRVSLLDQVHVSQRMIDCLDYLIFTIKQEQI